MKGATIYLEAVMRDILFQSTLPMKGATPPRNRSQFDMVSIHAPNEGSDPRPPLTSSCTMGVSIHAPNEGSDVMYAEPCFPMTKVSIHAPNEGSDLTLVIFLL